MHRLNFFAGNKNFKLSCYTWRDAIATKRKRVNLHRVEIMPVYLPTAIVANASTLVTLGHAGEIMGWFYPSKDHAQHVYQCLPAVYLGHSGQGSLHWTYENHWHCYQYYDGDCNICVTELTSEALALRLKISDVMAEDGAILLRRIVLQNIGGESRSLAFFCYGDWNMSGIRTGNALRFDHAKRLLVQSHREAALAIGGDAVETFQCGKAGLQWGSNALKDLDDGALCGQDLEIGDVNWAWGFSQYLHSGESTSRTVVFALAPDENAAMSAVQTAIARGFDKYSQERRALGEKTLEPGLKKLRSLGTAELPLDLDLAFKRSLLCLPLLCGNEGGGCTGIRPRIYFVRRLRLSLAARWRRVCFGLAGRGLS
jgi:GH15 family glucan-1,4-alpha-glucosidase